MAQIKNNTATDIQLAATIKRTPNSVVERYRHNRDWRYYPKEWIYRNVDFKGKDVLDFGCGTGEITTQLAILGANKVYGVDVTPGLLEQTNQSAEYDNVAHKCETVCGFIQDLTPRSVDVVIAFAVLHHCFPLENVLPSLVRWLKPGGTFVAVEPVVYFPATEKLRQLSGVEGDPLDEGERKLGPSDLTYVMSCFSHSRIVPFHVLGRLSRVYPKADRFLRRVDQALLLVPGMRYLSGTALIVCSSPRQIG